MKLTEDQVSLLKTEVTELGKVRDQLAENLKKSQNQLAATSLMISTLESLLQENNYSDQSPTLLESSDNNELASENQHQHTG